MNDQTKQDFPIEFRSDVESAEYNFYVEIENNLRELAKGHHDIISAEAHLEKPVEGRETIPLYEATVTAYMRPNNIAATEKADDPMQALQGALKALGRQVRDKREQLRNY